MKQNPNYCPKHLREHNFWTVRDLYEYAEVNGLLDAPIFRENDDIEKEYQGINGTNFIAMKRPFIYSKDECLKSCYWPNEYELLDDNQDYILIK